MAYPLTRVTDVLHKQMMVSNAHIFAEPFKESRSIVNRNMDGPTSKAEEVVLVKEENTMPISRGLLTNHVKDFLSLGSGRSFSRLPSPVKSQPRQRQQEGQQPRLATPFYSS